MVKYDQPVVSFAIFAIFAPSRLCAFAPLRLCAFAVRFSGSLRTQQLIGEALGALDDGITLLRDTNATFEAIAQALFKSWFVDFDPVRAKQEGRAPSRLCGEVFRFILAMGQSPHGDTCNEAGQGLPFYQGRTDFGSDCLARRWSFKPRVPREPALSASMTSTNRSVSCNSAPARPVLA